MSALSCTRSEQSIDLVLLIPVELLNILNRVSHHPLLIINGVYLEVVQLLLVWTETLLDVAC